TLGELSEVGDLVFDRGVKIFGDDFPGEKPVLPDAVAQRVRHMVDEDDSSGKQHPEHDGFRDQQARQKAHVVDGLPYATHDGGG
ncbi:MAG TPA: hypothetical protein QF520_12125, partial [SAR202 cluster bacterium]|nr:hypothetical protein [SAR202 cluster bacterium]